MNGLTIIYIVAALAIGYIFGIVTELFIDAGQIRYLNRKIDKYKLELEAMHRKNKAPQIVEIVDNRTASNDVDFGGF